MLQTERHTTEAEGDTEQRLFEIGFCRKAKTDLNLLMVRQKEDGRLKLKTVKFRDRIRRRY